MKLSARLELDHASGDFGKALEGYADQAQALEAEVERLRELVKQHRGENIPRTGSVSAPPQPEVPPAASYPVVPIISETLKRVQEQWAIERAQRRCFP